MMSKLKLLFFLLLVPLFSFSQFLPFDPSNWTVTFSDEFNGLKNPLWGTLIGDNYPWGNQTFSSNAKYLAYGTDGNKQYLDLRAYVENDAGTLKNYSAGIDITDKLPGICTNPNNPFYYGYYEIETRLTRNQNIPLDNVGLWPAFWFAHGEHVYYNGGLNPCNGTYKYWYEEVDIFEPGACYVKNDYNIVHYWTILDDNYEMDSVNTWRGEGYEATKAAVDMFNWHKYGLEWLPDRLTFYYDDIPYHTIQLRVPSHQKPHLWIDLQLSPDPPPGVDWCSNPRTTANTFIGSFQVNYFKFYALQNCNGEITEAMGDNYDFTNYSNALSNVKRYCIFKNSSLSSNANVLIHSNSVELKSNFTVPLNAVFEIKPTSCL